MSNEMERWLERVIEGGGLNTNAPSASPFLAITRSPSGQIRITDRGQTLTRAPRLAALVSQRNGMPARLFRSVLAHHGLAEIRGVIYWDAPDERIGGALFRFLSALARLQQILGFPGDAF